MKEDIKSLSLGLSNKSNDQVGLIFSKALNMLDDFISECVARHLEGKQQIVRIEEKKPSEEEYLTRSQVCEFLSISSSTLWRWTKSGRLPCIVICGKKRYSIVDIKNSMHKLEPQIRA